MPRTCTVCRHPAKNDINTALVAGTDSFRSLASRFGLSMSALKRHKAEHLPLTLTKAVQVAEVVHATSLVDQLQFLQRETFDILGKSKAGGDFRTALFAIMQARTNAELLERCQEKEREGRKLERYPLGALLEAEAETRAQMQEATQKLIQLAGEGRWPRGSPDSKLAAEGARLQLTGTKGNGAVPALDAPRS